jgi:membrane-bound metal-dependent hydrolase YbcI (DUF457 family)
MMGPGHIVVSSLAWMTAAPPIAEAFGQPMSGREVLVSTVAIAGWSVWPDWDHSDASLSRTLGPISKTFAKIVNLVSGGHRVGKTHSLLFAALMFVLAGALANAPTLVFGYELPANWALLVMMWFLAYSVMLTLELSVCKSSLLGDEIFALEAAAVVAVAVWLVPEQWWWMPWTALAGCLLHCLEDALTTRGVKNFFWPLRKPCLRMPLLGNAGGTREKVLTTAATGALAWVALATATNNLWWQTEWIT